MGADEARRAPEAEADALAPEDEELLREEVEAAARKERPDFTWLMRTKYISNDLYEPVNKQAGMNEKHAKQLRELAARAEVEDDGLDDRMRQVRAIQETFQDAARPPVHATKPGMRAVSVLPVVPDLDRQRPEQTLPQAWPGLTARARRWSSSYVHTLFDSDPTRDVEEYAGIGNNTRSELMAKAGYRALRLCNAACVLPSR